MDSAVFFTWRSVLNWCSASVTTKSRWKGWSYCAWMAGLGPRPGQDTSVSATVGSYSPLYSLSLTETPASLSITILLNDHTLFRANPCCDSLAWSGWVGAPKHGKTTGMPPRTGLLPSRAALPDTKRRSTGSELDGLGDFQEITVAPYSRISADDPYESLSVRGQSNGCCIPWDGEG